MNFEGLSNDSKNKLTENKNTQLLKGITQMVWVKICGIRTIEDAQTAALAGADAIGFVFTKSKREISLSCAKKIASFVPRSLLKVGVFVNPDPRQVQKAFEACALDFAQLHGNESLSFCKSLPLPVIKSFAAETELNLIHGFPNDYHILVDSGSGTQRGGTGQTFDWSKIKNLPNSYPKTIVAGGLTADNVHQLITDLNPFGVDVSSGVETNGKKCRKKIESFIKSAKK